MQDGDGAAAYDWSAIEGSSEFRELTSDRRRFAAINLAIGLGAGVLYVVLSGVAPDFMGTEVIGSITLAVLGGVALILITWAITVAYMRRSARVWQPLEDKVRQIAESERREAAAGAVGSPTPAEEPVR